MRLFVDLTPMQEEKLAIIAGRLNVAPEILAAGALRDLIDRSEDEFETVMAHVLEKNRELYRRLA